MCTAPRRHSFHRSIDSSRGASDVGIHSSWFTHSSQPDGRTTLRGAFTLVGRGERGLSRPQIARLEIEWARMAGVRAAILGLNFLLELAAVAALAYWGANRSPVALAVGLAIATPA